ncbi:MAG: TetR/AcrR family transcriptional regulator [Rhizobiaceae bacterium]|nr:TetR/AcrR family transcriptional regulator [Rhizobiaceae bacterium]
MHRRRQRKAPEVRAAEILAAARKLFFSRGYETTSVNDIIEATGLSKGAFYHHFDSKEALLEALAVELADENLAALQPLFEDRSRNAIERLNGLFAIVRRFKSDVPKELRAVFKVVFKTENVLLLNRVNKALLVRIAPVVTEILAEGGRDGTMRVHDAEAMAEMLLHLRMSMATVMNRAMIIADAGDLDAAAGLLETRMEAYGLSVDRVLGLPDGTISVSEPGFARAMLE